MYAYLPACPFSLLLLLLLFIPVSIPHVLSGGLGRNTGFLTSAWISGALNYANKYRLAHCLPFSISVLLTLLYSSYLSLLPTPFCPSQVKNSKKSFKEIYFRDSLRWFCDLSALRTRIYVSRNTQNHRAFELQWIEFWFSQLAEFSTSHPNEHVTQLDVSIDWVIWRILSF